MKRTRFPRFGLVRTALVTVLLLGLATLSVGANGPIDPPSVDEWLHPGESHSVDKSVTTPTLLPVADVVISADLTGSMGGELDNLKLEIDSIISALSGESADLNIGIVSHEDYPKYYDYCDYAAQYGDPASGDEPFRVDYPVGDNFTAAADAVTAMTLKYGVDDPESYARVMWESGQSDSGIGYRADAQKILVMFLDNVPHDCDLYGDGTTTTGVDPGRNATAGDGDDIDLQDDAVPAMLGDNITLLVVSSGSAGVTDLWDDIADATGGSAVQINSDGTVPGGISLTDLILDLIAEVKTDVWWEEPVCDPGLEVTLSPDVHYDVEGDTTVVFNELISVPNATDPGDYSCTVTFFANTYPDEGLEIGVQEIDIEVRPIRVDIDIKPGSFPNSINTKSKGVVPVAILGSASFDVTTVGVITLRLVPGGTPWTTLGATPAHDLTDPAVYAEHLQDVNLDGWMDLVSHYPQKDIGLASTDDQACLRGDLIDGRAFEGCDSVRVLH